VIELTEHEVFGAEGALEQALADLKSRGARVALDDAGAGYAGLQQLIRIAPDILKLDRALIHGAHADPSRRALLEALIAFAADTGAAVCGEGVEDLEDLRALVALDVTYAQGYGIARPGADWPAPKPEATAASAADIVAGLRVAGTRGGAFASALADLADELSSVRSMSELREASRRAAALLRADDVALMRVDRTLGRIILLTDHAEYGRDDWWSLADFPATEHVLEHRMPGQIVAGDDAGDPAELQALNEAGFQAMLMLPVICGGRELAVLEVYRSLPQAFTGSEVDRARVVAQQFGAALDRLTA
jgi:hypothetical protein